MNEINEADEANAAFSSCEEQVSDRQTFVENLGWTLKQTREGIKGCYLDDHEQVHIVYGKHAEKVVNVNGDSYAAIMYDVVKAIV